MKNLVYVIPMAGLGTRFLKAGYTLPKYMLQVRGTTVFEHSLRSLPLELASKLVFVALEAHKDEHALEAFLDGALRRLGCRAARELVLLDGPTSGQAETVLKARACVPAGAELAIYNIDTHFKSAALAGMLADPARKRDGVIGAFTLAEQDPKWSFAALRPDGTVAATAEKEQISENALTGFYHFTSAEDFFGAAAAALAAGRKTRGELYVAPLYNDLIAAGRAFALDRADSLVPLGTPEDLLKAEQRVF
ncbi:MAG: 2-C-methyl-D-erythritol 4-phosphate cytidylyltransferase [Elusimicrobiales bacterium]|nr:2-C-methyl-D-erythritol 4-phosphate cytidylyltransferase [Elusimicrobiales bacterium]